MLAICILIKLQTAVHFQCIFFQYLWNFACFCLCPYRAYAFLRDCGCGAILLRHIWKDENTIQAKDTQNVLNVLEEFISETDSSNLAAWKTSGDVQIYQYLFTFKNEEKKSTYAVIYPFSSSHSS